MIYEQKGENDKYPKEIKIWKIGEKIPEWLSDSAKVLFIDGNGNITLDTIDNNTGGYEIKSSSGDTLVSLKKKSDIVCFGNSKIFGLSEKQFNLIYNNTNE